MKRKQAPKSKTGWPMLQHRHSEFSDFVQQLKRQTKAEWEIEVLARQEIRTSEYLIPYNDDLNHTEIERNLSFLKEQAAAVAAHLKKKELTPEFLQLWSDYAAARGYVDCALNLKSDGLGKERSSFKGAQKQSKPQVQWFCNYVGADLKKGRLRKYSARRLRDYVCEIIDGDILCPKNFEKGLVPKDGGRRKL